jgi:eukaryotic-like serine/threonine-protein kinase
MPPPTDGNVHSGSQVPSAPESEREAREEVRRQGQQVGRYMLLKAVGQGGMGVVYAAYDPELDRKVALKLLHPGGRRWDRAQARARLQREAQAMARISHPHVIPVFDVGTHQDQVFVAMEFVEGGTLSDWLKKGEHTWREVLALFLQAGEGLAEAHAAGLVHRDFKPANVLLGKSGRVYVTDFGLARPVESLAEGQPDTGPVPASVPPPPLPVPPPSLLPPASPPQAAPPSAATATLSAQPAPEPEHTATAPLPMSWQPQARPGLQALTQAGVIVGTPSYMPPEQYMQGAQDARSDQFSFCAALYWALYKRRPFEHQQLRQAVESALANSPSTAELLQSLQRSTAPGQLVREPPREVPVPAWVRRALMRGLALDPEQRFGSMRELLAELGQEPRRVRQRWAVGAAGAALAVLAAVGVVGVRQGQVCTGADMLVAQVWGPVQRQRLESAFAATGSRLAASATVQVGQALDRYAQAWARQRTEACEATRRQGVQSEEVLARREVCLERRRKDLGALVRLLAEADGKLVERAVEVAQGLPDLEECADVESLASQQSLPADPSRRAEVERLSEELAEVRALVEAGRYKDSLARAQQLEPRVEATHWLPLLAETRLHLGWSQQRLGDKEAGQEKMLQAFFDAEVARATRLKLLICIRLLFNEGQLKRYEQAGLWGRMAEATLEHLGREPQPASEVAGQRAWLAMVSGHYPEARRLFEEASRLQALAGLPQGDARRARVLHMRGTLALREEEYERAIELLQQAREQTEAATGRFHPDTRRRYVMLGSALHTLGNHAAALESFRQSAEISEALFEPGNIKTLESKEYMAGCMAELGRGAEALEIFRGALEVKRTQLKPDDPSFYTTYQGLGLALSRLGRRREAIGHLEQALTYDKGVPQLFELAETGLVLAQALWEVGERPRALQEAARARQRYLEDQRPKLAARVDAWLQSVGASLEK